MKTIRIINVTEKQKRYALEYFSSHDPIKTYVKIGGISSKEAKRKRSYKSPLQSVQYNAKNNINKIIIYINQITLKNSTKGINHSIS